MSWNDAIEELNTRLPQFNDYILKDYRKEQVGIFPEFISTAFKEATRLFPNELEYINYQILSPEARIEYLKNAPLNKGKYNVQQSELMLVQYNFKHEGQFISVHLYLPYLFDNALIINNTHYYIQLAIIEKMIFRVVDGVIIKVMRSPLQFWRCEQMVYTSTRGADGISKGQQFCDAVITIRAHFRRKQTKKTKKTPLVLYFMCKFSLPEVMNMLSIPENTIFWTDHEDDDYDEWTYFEARPGSGVYLKVHTATIMPEQQYRRFVVSLLYILTMYKGPIVYEDLKTTQFYRTILGYNLYPTADGDLLAVAHATNHLDSLSTYLDPYTQKRLQDMSISCRDIFDLFANVFISIDSWLNDYSVNDLFAKRIGGADLILIEIVKMIFNRFYDTQRKKVRKHDHIKTMLRISSMAIAKIYEIQSLRANCSLYNDNDLISLYIKKIRQSSTQEKSSKKSSSSISDKEHQFHPSFVVIESPLAISASNPGISGDINPFAQIDRSGYFHEEKMPWYKDLKGLLPYLAQV